MKPESKFTVTEIYALAFGLFLGLAFWKFGNPVILDQKIIPPSTPSEFWSDAWPPHWANWIFLPLALAGALVAFKQNFWLGEIPREPAHGDTRPAQKTNWLWLLPLLWVGWQLISATQTVDADLTAATLWQLFGCVACYFLGALVIGAPSTASARTLTSQHAGVVSGPPLPKNAFSFLLIGVLAAFTFCLVRAVDQRLVEFPQSHRLLVEGERTGWTNVPPSMLIEMKRESAVITTNGADIANPVWLAKFAKGRVMGTLVYPNALAGAILLLLPLSLTLAFGAKKLRPAIRAMVVVLTFFLGGAGLFWSGSKLGWLIAMALGGLYLFRLKWPTKLKIAALAAIMILGLGIFAVRFHNYFAAGATSAGARLDYWSAAVQTTLKNPLVGSGPGTFKNSYERIKSPEAEMTRLTHNDYLEQFSDSGIPGGIFYSAWIALALVSIGRKIWKSEIHAGAPPALQFAIFIGLLGWFVQGIGEFSLYIPALAWTAFTLLGCLLAQRNAGHRLGAGK
jgi:O-antigen ligase